MAAYATDILLTGVCRPCDTNRECFLLAMPLMLLSGVFTSARSMPKAMQDFDLINPLTYMIDISRRVYLEGIGLGRLVPDLWPLAVMAVVTLAIGSWVFNRRLG